MRKFIAWRHRLLGGSGDRKGRPYTQWMGITFN